MLNRSTISLSQAPLNFNNLLPNANARLRATAPMRPPSRIYGNADRHEGAALLKALSELHPGNRHSSEGELESTLTTLIQADAAAPQNDSEAQTSSIQAALLNDPVFLEASWSLLENYEQTALLDILQSPVCIKLLAQAIEEQAPSPPLFFKSWRQILLKASSEHSCAKPDLNTLDITVLKTVLHALHGAASETTPQTLLEDGKSEPAIPQIFYKLRAAIWNQNALNLLQNFEKSADSAEAGKVQAFTQALKLLFPGNGPYSAYEHDPEKAPYAALLKAHNLRTFNEFKLEEQKQRLLNLFHSPLGLAAAIKALEQIPSDHAFLQSWKWLLAQESLHHTDGLSTVETAQLNKLQQWLYFEAEKTADIKQGSLYNRLNACLWQRNEAVLLEQFENRGFFPKEVRTLQQGFEALFHSVEHKPTAPAIWWSNLTPKQQTLVLNILHSPESIALLVQTQHQKSAAPAFLQSWEYFLLQETPAHSCTYSLDALDPFTIKFALDWLRPAVQKAAGQQRESVNAQGPSNASGVRAKPNRFYEQLHTALWRHARTELGQATKSAGLFHALTDIKGKQREEIADLRANIASYLTAFLEGKSASLPKGFFDALPRTSLVSLHRWTQRWGAMLETDDRFRERVGKLHAAVTQHLEAQAHFQKLETYFLEEVEGPIQTAIKDFQKACCDPSHTQKVQQTLETLSNTLTHFWTHICARRFTIFTPEDQNKISAMDPHKALNAIYQNKPIHSSQKAAIPPSLHERLHQSAYSRLQASLDKVQDAAKTEAIGPFPDPANTAMWPSSPLSQFIYSEIELALSHLYPVDQALPALEKIFPALPTKQEEIFSALSEQQQEIFAVLSTQQKERSAARSTQQEEISAARSTHQEKIFAALSTEQLHTLHHHYSKSPLQETTLALRQCVENVVVQRIEHTVQDLQNLTQALEAAAVFPIAAFKQFQSILHTLQRLHTPAIDAALESAAEDPEHFATFQELNRIPEYIEHFYTAINAIPTAFWASLDIEVLKDALRILTEPNRYTSAMTLPRALIHFRGMANSIVDTLNAACVEQAKSIYIDILADNAQKAILSFEAFFSAYTELEHYSILALPADAVQSYIDEAIASLSAHEKEQLHTILNKEVYKELRACLLNASFSIKADHGRESKQLDFLSSYFSLPTDFYNRKTEEIKLIQKLEEIQELKEIQTLKEKQDLEEIQELMATKELIAKKELKVMQKLIAIQELKTIQKNKVFIEYQTEIKQYIHKKLLEVKKNVDRLSQEVTLENVFTSHEKIGPFKAIQKNKTFIEYQEAIKEYLHIELFDLEKSINQLATEAALEDIPISPVLERSILKNIPTSRVLRGTIPEELFSKIAFKFKEIIPYESDKEKEELRKLITNTPQKITGVTRKPTTEFENFFEGHYQKSIIKSQPSKLANYIKISDNFLIDISRRNINNLSINGKNYPLSYSISSSEEEIVNLVSTLIDFCKSQNEFLLISFLLTQFTILSCHTVFSSKLVRLPEMLNLEEDTHYTVALSSGRKNRFISIDRQADASALLKITYKLDEIKETPNKNGDPVEFQPHSSAESQLVVKIDATNPDLNERVKLLRKPHFEHNLQIQPSDSGASTQQTPLHRAADSIRNASEQLQNAVASAHNTAVSATQNLYTRSAPLREQIDASLKHVINVA